MDQMSLIGCPRVVLPKEPEPPRVSENPGAVSSLAPTLPQSVAVESRNPQSAALVPAPAVRHPKRVVGSPVRNLHIPFDRKK